MNRISLDQRPNGNMRYYSSAGDNVGLADGDLLLFDLSDIEASETLTITLSNDVFIRSINVFSGSGCPLGARIDVEMLNPNDSHFGWIAKQYGIFPNQLVKIEMGDVVKFPEGRKLKIVVYNAGVLAAFKTVVSLELYRPIA